MDEVNKMRTTIKVTIGQCLLCPYAEREAGRMSDQYRCQGKRKIPDEETIPKWCPILKAQMKGEVKDE